MLNPRVWVTFAGAVVFVVFLATGLGAVPALGSVTNTGGPPCGQYNCNGPIITTTPPAITPSGLNATIVVTGQTYPVGVVTTLSAVLSVAGANFPLAPTVASATGAFAFAPYHYTGKSTGTFPVFSTVTGAYIGGTVTSTSAVVTMVLNSTGTPPPPPTCGSLCPTASAAFSVSVAGLAVNLTDHSTTSYATTSLTKVTIAWGDGSTSPDGVGGKVAHLYSTAGVYTITDTVAVTNGTYSSSSATTLTITVAPGPGGGGGSTPPPAPVATTAFNAVVDAGIGLGVGLIVMGATGRWLEGGLLTLGLVGGGYFIGPFL